MPTITHLAYTRVAVDAAPGRLQPREHDAGVDAFLLDHMSALLKSASDRDAPVARFLAPSDADAFTRLRTGSDSQFYETARALAVQLIARMDGRAAPGLLVCVRGAVDGKVSAAALKLEVVTQHAAILEALDTGEQVLSGVTDVLDAPGDLQKGALVEDPRPDSDVIVGDRLAQDALYFPAAFGIATDQRSAAAAADLIQAIHARDPQAAAAAARALPQVSSRDVDQVLSDLSEQGVDLPADARADIADALAGRPRPVRTVRTDAAVKKVWQADGIVVTAPAAAADAVTVARDPEADGWTITVRVREQPREHYKK